MDSSRNDYKDHENKAWFLKIDKSLHTQFILKKSLMKRISVVRHTISITNLSSYSTPSKKRWIEAKDFLENAWFKIWFQFQFTLKGYLCFQRRKVSIYENVHVSLWKNMQVFQKFTLSIEGLKKDSFHAEYRCSRKHYTKIVQVWQLIHSCSVENKCWQISVFV